MISDDETLFSRCPVRWCGRETHWRPRSEKTPPWRKESTSRRASLLNSPPGQMWELSNLFGNPWLLCFGSNMICLPNCPKYNFVEYSFYFSYAWFIDSKTTPWSWRSLWATVWRRRSRGGRPTLERSRRWVAEDIGGHVGQYEDIWYQWGGMDQIRMDQRIWVTHCEKGLSQSLIVGTGQFPPTLISSQCRSVVSVKALASYQA